LQGQLYGSTKVRLFMFLLLTVQTAGITPVVPAAEGVGNADRNRLRVDYDDVVQFSDLVVTSVSSKLVSEIPSERIQHTICFIY